MAERTGHPRVLTMGFSEAGMYLRQAGPAAVSAIISICGKGECAVEAPGVPHLVLRFDDVDAIDEQDQFGRVSAWARRRWAAETGRGQAPPTEEDARAIVQFALRIRDRDGVLLCHCSGGVSRSPAAALICLAAWKGEGNEVECVRDLMADRPCASPLQTLVALGDQALGRGGKLVEGLRQWSRANAPPP